MAAGTRRRGGAHGDATGPFTAEQTHGVALRPENSLIMHSEGLGWRGAYADIIDEAPYETHMPAASHPGFACSLRGTGRIGCEMDAGPAEWTFGPRQFVWVPPGVASRWWLREPLTVLHVYVRQSTFDRFAEETHGADPKRVEILARLGIFDPLLEQLALSVMRAMQERPPGHALYVDCLAQAMAAHLVQHHSTLTRPPRVPKPDGLTDWRLRRLADYIEAHLGAGLSLEAMAGQTGLSPLYFARAFKRAFGEPPHAYVTRRRIERAKALLRDTGLPLAEVALVCGFGSQSHMGEAFRRGVGTSPGAYRRDV